jgi:alpha-tubulin suppressor-like RCC1 family protein
VRQILAINNSSFVVMADGCVYGWGSNEKNILGFGTEKTMRAGEEGLIIISL